MLVLKYIAIIIALIVVPRCLGYILRAMGKAKTKISMNKEYLKYIYKVQHMDVFYTRHTSPNFQEQPDGTHLLWKRILCYGLIFYFVFPIKWWIPMFFGAFCLLIWPSKVGIQQHLYWPHEFFLEGWYPIGIDKFLTEHLPIIAVPIRVFGMVVSLVILYAIFFRKLVQPEEIQDA